MLHLLPKIINAHYVQTLCKQNAAEKDILLITAIIETLLKNSEQTLAFNIQ